MKGKYPKREFVRRPSTLAKVLVHLVLSKEGHGLQPHYLLRFVGFDLDLHQYAEILSLSPVYRWDFLALDHDREKERDQNLTHLTTFVQNCASIDPETAIKAIKKHLLDSWTKRSWTHISLQNVRLGNNTQYQLHPITNPPTTFRILILSVDFRSFLFIHQNSARHQPVVS